MTPLSPFLRWAGGKTWAADRLVSFARTVNGGQPVAYCEPFLGGGGWLVRMLSEGLVLKGHCYLGDLAPEAYLVWKSVLANPVRTAMKAQRWLDFVLESDDKGRAYYQLRGMWNSSHDTGSEGRDLIEVAGLLIAMNRLSFKGLLRVNSSGEFNTPYGHLPKPFVDRDAIIKMGLAMRAVGARFISGGWACTVEAAESHVPGVLAVDPPYAGTTHVAYTAHGWTGLDRLQLSGRCRMLTRMGWSMLATDAHLPAAWDAWAWAEPRRATRPGGMSDGVGRGRDEFLDEIIMTVNNEPPGKAALVAVG